jgi:transposase-like protein
MVSIPRSGYTKGFKEEAVKLVKESGLSIREIAKRLTILTGTLAYWVKKDYV